MTDLWRIKLNARLELQRKLKENPNYLDKLIRAEQVERVKKFYARIMKDAPIANLG